MTSGVNGSLLNRRWEPSEQVRDAMRLRSRVPVPDAMVAVRTIGRADGLIRAARMIVIGMRGSFGHALACPVVVEGGAEDELGHHGDRQDRRDGYRCRSLSKTPHVQIIGKDPRGTQVGTSARMSRLKRASSTIPSPSSLAKGQRLCAAPVTEPLTLSAYRPLARCLGE